MLFSGWVFELVRQFEVHLRVKFVAAGLAVGAALERMLRLVTGYGAKRERPMSRSAAVLDDELFPSS